MELYSEKMSLDLKDYALVKKKLISIFEENVSSQLVFLCIGTDQSTGDSFGPLVGKFLIDSHIDYPVYGTLESPVDALNLRSTVQEINHKYNNPLIIAIDASVGEKQFIGRVFLKKGALIPGKYAKKKLPSVGHYHLCAVVNERSTFFKDTKLHETRLFDVIQYAMRVSALIIDSLYEVHLT